MNTLMEKMIEKINTKYQDNHPIVCIPDGEDERILEALKYLKNMDIVLLGAIDIIEEKLAHYQYDESINVKVLQPFVCDTVIDNVLAKTKDFKKPISREFLTEWSIHAPSFAMMLLKANYVDCVVGGSSYPTKEILSPMLKLIKAKEEGKLISSYMLLTKGEENLIFSDCALNVNYDVDGYVNLIYDTYQSASKLGIKPNIALLSYSTLGSGSGDSIEFIKQALAKFKSTYPQLVDCVCGEIQFDAAYDIEVRKKKIAESSSLAINTFIFPDLNSGNIGYKIAQYLGGYKAIGPIIQGASQPVNDLSRGAKPEEIAQVIYLTVASI